MNTDQFDTFLKETKDHLAQVVKITVNGKIDSLHREVTHANEQQDKKLEEIKKSVEDVVTFYDTSGKVFRGAIIISKFLIAIGGAVAILWTFFKFVVISSIPK